MIEPPTLLVPVMLIAPVLAFEPELTMLPPMVEFVMVTPFVIVPEFWILLFTVLPLTLIFCIVLLLIISPLTEPPLSILRVSIVSSFWMPPLTEPVIVIVCIVPD